MSGVRTVLMQRLGCLVQFGSIWGNQHLCMQWQDSSQATVYAGQHPKPQHRFPNQGNPTLVHQTGTTIQATIEITWRDHSIIACSCHIYMGVILRAHSVHGESHIQHNANWELATADRKLLLLKACQHWNIDKQVIHASRTEPPQTSRSRNRSCIPKLSCNHINQSCSSEGKNHSSNILPQVAKETLSLLYAELSSIMPISVMSIRLDWIRTMRNFVDFGLDPNCKLLHKSRTRTGFGLN